MTFIVSYLVPAAVGAMLVGIVLGIDYASRHPEE